MTNTPAIARTGSAGFESGQRTSERIPTRTGEKQVNTLVNSQLQSARHLEDERPDRETFEDSPLLDS